jgi:hypothetical protein
MAANQKQLAKLAVVSAGTVSNVVSGSTRVSESSRQKVLEAIRILNYQPNLIARSVKTNRTHTDAHGSRIIQYAFPGSGQKRAGKSQKDLWGLALSSLV